MFHLLLLAHLLFQPPGNEQLDSFYLNWMQTTFQTLEHRSHNASDSLKENYLNRSHRFKTPEPNGTRYPRYIFTKEQFANIKSYKGDLFIIELIMNSSALVFIDIIIYKNENRVDVFRLGRDNSWCLNDSFTYNGKYLEDDLSKYYLENGKGINFVEPTITKISSGKVISSEYYLSRSLSPTCGLQNILDRVW